jgi:hypothetical protein
MELGKTVRDRITGFVGVVTGRCQYISGCDQALVQPAVDADQKFVEARWFDVDRLVTDPAVPPVALEITSPGPDRPAPRK